MDESSLLVFDEHGVVSVNAKDFDVRYTNPLLLGSLEHDMFQVKMKTSSKPLKAFLQIASTPITSKSQHVWSQDQGPEQQGFGT